MYMHPGLKIIAIFFEELAKKWGGRSSYGTGSVLG